VSDPEVPTLADAAQAIVDWWDKQGTVGEPWQKIERLRAALGQRERELAEVRDTSRREVLATRTTTIAAFSPKRYLGRSLLDVRHLWLDVPPGTEVVVVRSAEDKETPNG
jgi:hypothetical protein